MKKQITLVLALAFTGYGVTAQQALKVAPGRVGMYPAAVEFTPGQEPDFVRGSVLLKQQDAFTRTTDVILKSSEKDQIGQEHFRYQQKINGIPVEGAVYAVHVAGGKVKSQNGDWIAEQPANLAVAPTISEGAALQVAMKAFGAKKYKWELPAEEAFIKKESGDATSTFMPKGELVYYSDDNELNVDKMRLAYRLDLYAHEPIGRRLYFIDAQTGAVLGSREIMHTINATGTAVTAFSGTLAITTDNVAPDTFRLQETGRGNGIQTFNMNQGLSYSAATDFIDDDNNWNNANTSLDQYATDAHWGAEMTYDYYKNTFNRNSINNAGYAIKSYVHYYSNYFNAFWDGARMTYGDGAAIDNYKPLTSIDVCGHEITHGITAYTANLNYSYESGALNEGFSDIFGTTIEFYAKPATANWELGEAFYTVRSMSNPKAYGQPNTYKGVNWAIGSADNGGVHTNSGVVNYWYYLLAVGGTGTNDYNYSYSLTGIGLAKAAAIAYRTLTVYLTSNSQYSQTRTLSIQAATDLYGANSTEVAAVNAAWAAVGLVAPIPPPPCSDIYESNNARTTANTIPTNTDIAARLGTLGDKDYYVFTTTAAAPKLKVTLGNLPADYDLKLYSSNGTTQLGVSGQSGLSAESITYNVGTGAATYYIYIYGFNNVYDATNCYTLRVATSNINQSFDQNSNFATNQTSKKPDDMELNGDQVSVFPNPAKDKLTLSFNADEDGKQSVSITDIIGHVMMEKTFDVQQGTNNISLPLDNYKSGIYFLNVEGRQASKFQVTQ